MDVYVFFERGEPAIKLEFRPAIIVFGRGRENFDDRLRVGEGARFYLNIMGT